MEERCTNQTKPEYFTKLEGVVSSAQKVLFQLVRTAQIIDPRLESFVTRGPIWFNLGNGYQGTCDSFYAGARTHSRNGNPRKARTRAINSFRYVSGKTALRKELFYGSGGNRAPTPSYTSCHSRPKSRPGSATCEQRDIGCNTLHEGLSER